jgi:hypothetical protein
MSKINFHAVRLLDLSGNPSRMGTLEESPNEQTLNFKSPKQKEMYFEI